MSRLSESDLQQFRSNLQRGTHPLKATMRGSSAVKTRMVTGSTPASSSSPFKPFTLALVGQMISGKNRVMVRRDGKHFPLKQFTNWRSQAHFQILEQRPALPPAIMIPVTLYCQYWPGDKKKRDVDGMLSALFHLLVYAKVLKDDGLIYTCRWWRYPLCAYPKVVMEIAPWN